MHSIKRIQGYRVDIPYSTAESVIFVLTVHSMLFIWDSLTPQMWQEAKKRVSVIASRTSPSNIVNCSVWRTLNCVSPKLVELHCKLFISFWIFFTMVMILSFVSFVISNLIGRRNFVDAEWGFFQQELTLSDWASTSHNNCKGTTDTTTTLPSITSSCTKHCL